MYLSQLDIKKGMILLGMICLMINNLALYFKEFKLDFSF